MCIVATEDFLSESVALKLARRVIRSDIEIQTLGRKGFGYLKSNFHKFCEIANRRPVIILTDLDRTPCAPSLVSAWSQSCNVPDRMCLRVAVREVESWLLADRKNFSEYIGVPISLVPRRPDELADPKATIINIAKRGSRSAKYALVPKTQSASAQGIEYNEFLIAFVASRWNLDLASSISPSLARAIRALTRQSQGMR